MLISGDQVLPTISPNVSVLATRPDSNPLAEFLESLARLEQQCPPETLVLMVSPMLEVSALAMTVVPLLASKVNLASSIPAYCAGDTLKVISPASVVKLVALVRQSRKLPGATSSRPAVAGCRSCNVTMRSGF